MDICCVFFFLVLFHQRISNLLNNIEMCWSNWNSFFLCTFFFFSFSILTKLACIFHIWIRIWVVSLLFCVLGLHSIWNVTMTFQATSNEMWFVLLKMFFNFKLDMLSVFPPPLFFSHFITIIKKNISLFNFLSLNICNVIPMTQRAKKPRKYT